MAARSAIIHGTGGCLRSLANNVIWSHVIMAVFNVMFCLSCPYHPSADRSLSRASLICAMLASSKSLGWTGRCPASLKAQPTQRRALVIGAVIQVHAPKAQVLKRPRRVSDQSFQAFVPAQWFFFDIKILFAVRSGRGREI